MEDVTMMSRVPVATIVEPLTVVTSRADDGRGPKYTTGRSLAVAARGLLTGGTQSPTPAEAQLVMF